MKFLLVLAVLVVAFWIWRNNRQIGPDEGTSPKPPQPRASRTPMVMVACQHCGTHLPESEALTGRLGAYCCPEHRQQHEGASR
ncbi:hypothetical protein KIH07_08465 [Hydrogenophaga taeniospiralis]|jgi:uncharacterized protein|uniref:PP0621 family protein n=1 Tax=Hydrogenophaga taeniospiralis TaxID=65656 RepID=UPI001CFBFD53|nr:PP0621 family protein [Hydrogenophaga taeniospiralis]MCB4363765.1 hypothetical protein [Hydrogenophaga taeniospiralis]